MGGRKAILIDSAALEESASLEKLLSRLAYSNLYVCLLFTNGRDYSETEDSLKKWGISDSVTVVKANTEEDVREYVKTKWPVVPGQSLFVSSNAEAPFTKLQNSGAREIYGCIICH